MAWHYTPFMILVLIAAGISVVLSVHAWRHRTVPGGTASVWLMLAVGVWSLSYAFELASHDSSVKIFLSKIKYAGIISVSPAWLLFALEYTDRREWLTRRRSALITFGPFVTLLLTWTNELHGLVWRHSSFYQEGSLLLSERTYGPWFWVHTMYSYILLFLGTILIARAILRSSHLYRWQAVAVLAAVLMPWVGNALYVFRLSPLPNLDLTPLAFTLTGLAIVWGLVRYRLFDLIPVARDAVVEGMGDGMIVVDTQDRIVDLNPAAQNIIGVPVAQAIGGSVVQFLPTWHDLIERYQDVPETRAEIALDANGRQRHYDLRISSLTDQRGRLTGRLVVLRDITQRVQMEEALRRRNRGLALLNQAGQKLTATLDVEQVTEQLLQAVTETVDVEGALVWILEAGQRNHFSCEEALREDASQGSLVCRACYWLGRGTPPANLHLRLDQGVTGWVAQTGKSVIVPYTPDDPRFLIGIDQQTGFHTASLLAVPLWVRGEVIGVLEAVNKLEGEFDEDDLTLLETLAASAAIALDNARLVEAQRQYTAQLEARNVELDAFAHTVAHDLKSPLTWIIGYASLLEEDYDTTPAEELQHSLGIISKSGRKMNAIIDELLLLSSVRTAKDIETHPLDMASIVAEVEDRLAPMIQEYQAEIVLPESWPVALGHGPWIEEVWANYLSNALKHGGQPPRVALGATEQGDGTVRFWVHDNGAGISPEEQTRLFTPFTRLDQLRQVKGHGLGLSIVRRIVEKLGGQVGVESKVGRGSVFSFTLPGKEVNE